MAGRLGPFALSALVVTVLAHWWAGPHVFDQLGRARDSVSFAMPWRLLLEAMAGPLAEHTARTVVGIGAVLLFVLFVVALARLTRSLVPVTVFPTAARWTLVLSAAYALAAPYSLPWYDLLVWVTLPALAPSALDLLLLARLLVMSVAYVPGRVSGVTRGVWDLTLGLRRRVAPVAHLGVWLWLTTSAGRGSWRSRVPRPPAP